ncbi:MAG: ribosomal protein S18-alanine N-acetyltransferase [bacterium]|nr:ribosomal protein S18-alanine N-acetyltransferase [bacterium]
MLEARGAAQKGTFRIRPMIPDDLGQVLVIERASFSLAWSESAFRRELDIIPNSYLSVAEGAVDGGDGTPVVLGYTCWWHVVDECHITNFAVAPFARRGGVGDFLLKGLLEEARRLGVRRATLEVRMGNEAGIALYTRNGFTSIAIRKQYYPDNREDALVMWKEEI